MAADAAPRREPDREPPTSPGGWTPTGPAAALLPLVCVIDALSEAQQRTPTEWSLYLLAAEVLEEIDPVSEARRLNPQGDEIAELEARLGE